MPKVDSAKKRRERVATILPILEREYPHARCSLDFTTPLELLVATILSAQCTDARVNLTTPALFARYETAADYADSDPAELETFVASCGFFRQKAKSIRGMAAAVVERHGGEVPASMDDLVKLPGVGRKTANVVLGEAFGVAVGVTVDTHVGRLSRRLGLTGHEDAVKVERDLMAVVPREHWVRWSHLLIFHGRRTCVARSPRCEVCCLLESCPTGPKLLRQGKPTTRKATPSSKRATGST